MAEAEAESEVVEDSLTGGARADGLRTVSFRRNSPAFDRQTEIPCQ